MSASRRDALSPSLAEHAFAWFYRVVAIYCLISGLSYWVRLVGVYSGALWRFDLMPSYWQVASVSLAALFPFAAIGLWMLASWGVVVWLVCAAAEIFMYWIRPDLFGSRPVVVVTQLAIAATYVVFLVVIRRQRASQ